MLTDEETLKLIRAVEAKTIYQVFAMVNSAAVDWSNQKPGQAFRSVFASGEGWTTQLLLLGPN